MGYPMGLGPIGGPDVVFKRKFRWTFEIANTCIGRGISPYFVKVAARPNLEIEETEINFLHGKTWIPGKATWQAITVTYYDTNSTVISDLYSWISGVYNIMDPINLQMNSKVSGYTGTGILTLYDGCGKAMERWQLGNLWPQAINFGELDYANSEECTVELTMRFTNVKYTSYCPPGPNPCSCDPC